MSVPELNSKQMEAGGRPTPSQVRELVSYDHATGLAIWNARGREWFKRDQDHVTWNKRFAGRPALNSVDKNGYRCGCILSHPTSLHRIAYAWMTGNWPTDSIDHINRDKLDNRWVNLRHVTAKENQRNTALSKNNNSGHNGVHWSKGAKKWQSTITVDRKTIYLGVYEHIADAVSARICAEDKYGFMAGHGVPK